MYFATQNLTAAGFFLFKNLWLAGGRRGRGGFGSGGGGGGRTPVPPTNKLMVFNLSKRMEPYQLEEIFAGCNDVYLPKDRETGEKRG